MKNQYSKHQRYIKSLPVSSKKFSSQKIKFLGISLKSLQKHIISVGPSKLKFKNEILQRLEIWNNYEVPNHRHL